MRFIAWLLLGLLGWLTPAFAWAVEVETVQQLAGEDIDLRLGALANLAGSGDPGAAPILQALHDSTLNRTPDGRFIILDSDRAIDALSGKALDAVPENLESIGINNRIRAQLEGALAGLKLLSPERELRLAAAKELQANPGESTLPAIERAILAEKDATILGILSLTKAQISLKNSDAAVRLDAVKALAGSTNPSVRSLLAQSIEKRPDGSYAEPDEKVRLEIAASLKRVQRRLTQLEWLGHAFSGLSLGSVLLLAALGLAITFGLMGIINMAHGELLMIGAYATYVMQGLFRHYFPGAVDWYLVAAIPFSFLIAALVGVVLERGVIRFLYGRPLETLLCTWGISLILIQTVRSLFGAQNVEVANPSWMSGGMSFASGLTLPYNRIAIIAFAALVVFLVWLLLNRTRLGLFVRAVTQNRTMADCVGVPTGRIDMWTFGLGSGIAGLGGCALSQIGNVGPELGQAYIVDSFMVVVLGGVGQLAGTIIAALGLGEVNKFLEPHAGAVLGKIFVLIFIIVFIQKRPQGLFAIKGRSAEALA